MSRINCIKSYEYDTVDNLWCILEFSVSVFSDSHPEINILLLELVMQIFFDKVGNHIKYFDLAAFVLK